MEYLVKGDTAAAFTATITNNYTGQVEPLTGTTVLLKVRRRHNNTVDFTVTGEEGDFANGVAVFKLGSNMNSITPGYYEGEIEVTYPGGSVSSVYELVKFAVRNEF